MKLLNIVNVTFWSFIIKHVYQYNYKYYKAPKNSKIKKYYKFKIFTILNVNKLYKESKHEYACGDFKSIKLTNFNKYFEI